MHLDAFPKHKICPKCVCGRPVLTNWILIGPTSNECLVPASQIIRNVSVIQKRQDIIEDEVKQMGKRMNAAEAKIEQNKREADNHMKDHESGIQELKKQVRELDVKLHFVEDEVAANG